MKYELYSLGLKNLPNLRLVLTGTRAECNRELSSRRMTDKTNEYGVYDCNGRLLASTLGGGANPHAWDTRASGKSRKRSGLPGPWPAAKAVKFT